MRAGWARNPWAVLLGLLLLGNAVVFVAYTLPRTLRERSLESRAAVLEGEVREERVAAEAVSRQTEALLANAEDARRFTSEILTDRLAGLLPTLEEFESTARGAGLRPAGRTFHPEELKSLPVVQFVVVMPLSGSYAQILSFLEALEASRRFVTVDQIQLHAKQGSGGQDLAVVLSAYFRSERRGES